ncbi:hypothetical protein F0562_030064 [Nyssa sinensis]|uniref:Bulb-type lectin domain-containing protein n=1 Tax=Nyssa sinensis TaxID=561372 RepID=A0A5J5B1R7_9ASTE|nr:hypothetical protein F0562_030064 [Nyssa sinensis]
MRSIYICLVILCCIGLFKFFGTEASNVGNTLKPGEVMRQGEHLESLNKKFRLQFFKDSLSDYAYLVIQYMGSNAKSRVWVANQDHPLYYYLPVLNFTLDGYLVIVDAHGTLVQLSFEQPGTISETSAILDDSGNFVLREGEQIIWKSYNHPTDTWLPGMKLGWFDLKSRKPQKRFLTSWRTPEGPYLGIFTLGVDMNNTKQLVIWKRGEVYWRSEIWNGQSFSSFIGIQKDIGYNLLYFSSENESYFTFPIDENSYLPLMQIDWRGQIVLLSENSLTINLAPSKCKDGDVFSETRGFMDEGYNIDNYSLLPSDCAEICQSNCSCNAFTYGSLFQKGCKFARASPDYEIDESGEILFIRKSNLVDHSRRLTRLLWFRIGGSVLSLAVMTIISLLCCLKWKHRSFRGRPKGSQDACVPDWIKEKEHDLPFFSFSSIEIATDHFSDANKLGHGGFGPVYKFFGIEASPILNPGRVMRLADHLESWNGKFRLQFLRDDLTNLGYLVIQYMGSNAVSTVWVANQFDPQSYLSIFLNFTLDGYLVVDDGYGTFVQLNSEKAGMGSDTSTTLDDSGNFVLREGERILWQSSDHPTDTWLPGMKLGLFGLKLGQPQKQFLTSWMSPQVTNGGLFTLGLDLNNTKQLVVWKREEIYWRSETWNGQNFSSFLGIQKDIGYNLRLESSVRHEDI